ncbi:MAG: lipoprotein-releasing system ATP-binding protein LolD [Legionellales bacterium]|nr:lipoprotein-releasing system ATP-binding protein LolD [Legionellales bacterium]|tara:strand:- start:46140 stop:46832 length:693 start_codon:yes stop_codon:yes gene_type:complete
MNDVTHGFALQCQHIAKTYHDGKLEVPVLNDVDFAVKPGEQLAIVGASGEGKSTLLHVLGGLDKPSKGSVLVDGVDVNRLSEKKRCRFRNQKLGFVYQLHHLLFEFSVLENVAMPVLLGQGDVSAAIEAATQVLDKVGLSHRLEHKISEISGGERQRAAIARALVNNPSCVLADEPTGNLDHRTADKVYDTFLELNREYNTSIIIVTHDPRLAQRMDRVLILEGGTLIEA